MPYRDGKLKRNDSSMTSSILYPSVPQSSLIHTGLLAGAVAGAPENRPVPVLDDSHELTDNESGGPASIKKLLTSLNCLRPSITDGHRVSLVCKDLSFKCRLNFERSSLTHLNRPEASMGLNLVLLELGLKIFPPKPLLYLVGMLSRPSTNTCTTSWFGHVRTQP